ncbi:Maf family protein [Marinomonas sp. 15G1-11]|uniref:7-methyl-GTP pyrophosphatase n=1 Tax=Marinomonas phaeophyticola TaxID=3004091 RepID=A0ABT4JPD1_9GAMM|nr:Maf family protein [Marinomonas sp. 15G1-11]MCZ2720233.1 Maf family protein [Marinomonas sp. 15G1-11]
MSLPLILASSSPYRKQLLERLHLNFHCLSPEIDETPLANETANNLVSRLAYQKATAVKNTLSDNAIIIASDQVALLEDTILGKPHTVENAINQLLSFSGKKVTFLTSLCILNSDTEQQENTIEVYQVYFRNLTRKEIEHYIKLESPLDCAGSFKCEGLGVTLFHKMEGDDPTSLVGLPLIALSRLLRRQKVNPLEP